MKLAATTAACMLLAQAVQGFAPLGASTFTPSGRMPSAVARSQQQPSAASPLVMKDSANPFQASLQSLAKTLATLTAAAAIMTGAAEAEAANSGGRVGGRSFSSSSPSRSYSAPSRSYASPGGSYAAPSYRSSTTIVPVPMPMPMMTPMPFYGGGFYGPAAVVAGPSNLLFDLVVVGGVVLTASQLLNAQRSMTGGWGSIDDSSSSLGSGVSVLKLQLALSVDDRSSSGLLGQLKTLAERAETDSRGGLSAAVSETCLALIRRQSDWMAASSKFEYFGQRNAERAEAVFNNYAIDERTKVERETVARFGGEDLSEKRLGNGVRPEDIGKPTKAVVTIVLALKGDSLRRFELERRLNSSSTARKVLSQLAADVATDDGENVLGAEILWTPEEPWESLDRQAVIEDFPELIDL